MSSLGVASDKNALAAYAAFFMNGFRSEASKRAVLFGRCLMFVIFLFVFTSLWTVTLGEDTGLAGYNRTELVWYLAVTEWIFIGVPFAHLDVQQLLRSGDAAYRLSRPASWFGAQLAESAGQALLRLPVMGVVAFAAALVLTGEFPAHPERFVFVVVCGLIAAVAWLTSCACIGLAATWLHDVSPLWWVWQKFAFVTGGLLLPLEVCPKWVMDISIWTPHAAMLYAPARMLAATDLAECVALFARATGWLAVMLIVAAWWERRVRRSIEIGGG